jgi:Transposase IS66 family
VRLQWLHVAVSEFVTVYAILPGRGYTQAVTILGAEYDGFLVHDGWAPYYRFESAFHQSCLSHLLKRCREMAQIAMPPEAAFSSGGAGSAADQPGIAGPLCAGRDFRAWHVDGQRETGSQTGREAGHTLSGSGEPETGASSHP